MKKIFFKEIENIKECTKDIITEDSKDTIFFKYKNLYASASQIGNDLITFSRINFSFSFYMKGKNKNQIYHYINIFNKEVALVKIYLDKIEKNEVFLEFKIEYSLNDEEFKSSDLERDIKYLVSSTKAFDQFLNDKNPFGGS